MKAMATARGLLGGGTATAQQARSARTGTGSGVGEPAEVRLAVAELGLGSKVLRGENEGRTLQHAAVARTLETVGAIAKGQKSARVESELRIAEAWKRPQLRIVAFVQGTKSNKVLAAAVAPAG